MNKEDIKKIISDGLKKASFRKDIKKVSLFGSYLNGRPRKNSDVDLLIEFNPSAKVGFFYLIDIKETIEKLVGKNIDLLTPDGLSKYFRKDVLRQAEIIYEK